MAGAKVRCPVCQQTLVVPSSASALVPATPSGSQSPVSAIKLPSGEQRPASGESSVGGENRRRRDAIAGQPSLGMFGQYDLKEELGSGGFGVVYRAWDTKLGRQVALKVPRLDATERNVRRFRQEARSAAKLQHPNIVVVLGEGMHDDKPYMVSEFVDGETLAKRIERRRPPLKTSVAYVRDLASALSYAHQEGVVHRDIKPENIMIGTDGRPRVMDFGLAKQLDEDSSLSIDGSVLGTPSYMSPEQARGETANVNGKSDQYSLGVVLYELLTGEKPFDGPAHAVLSRVANRTQEPPAPRSLNKTIPRDLEAICLKAMSKESAARYADLSNMASDLERWLQGQATSVRPVSRPELAIRWCRKNPALTAITTVGALAIVLAAALTANALRGPRTDTGELANSQMVASASSVEISASTRPIDETSLLEQPALATSEPIVTAPASVVVASAPAAVAPSTQAEAFIATAPPLDEWLKGREVLTVAQDGSAMFTTITDAIEAQQTGQVIRVLDRGPYRESINWRSKSDCGLVSDQNTIIECPTWKQVHTRTENRLGHSFNRIIDCRLHGFNFQFSADNPDQKFLLHTWETGGLCIEACVFGPNATPTEKVNPVVQINPVVGAHPRHGVTIRDSVFTTGLWIHNIMGEDHIRIHNNFFYFSPDASDRSFESHFGYAPHSGNAKCTLELSENVFISNANKGGCIHLGGDNPLSSFHYRSNTVGCPFGRTISVGGIWGLDVSVEDSLHLVLFDDLHFDGETKKLIPLAKSRWTIRNCIGNSFTNADPMSVQLSTPLPTEIPFLSKSPLDRSFLRVDADAMLELTSFAASGSANQKYVFPGALPPGPPPAEGDWFTRLQDRLRESLESLPREQLDRWSQPLQLFPAVQIYRAD